MGALFLVRTDDDAFADSALAAARDQFALHGLPEPIERRFGGWAMLHAAPVFGGVETLAVRGGDFVAVAGTPSCDGKIGGPALEAIFDMPMPEPDWDRLGGQFVALVRRGGRAFLLGDYFAAFQLFHDSEQRIFSTSLLAAVRALPRVSFDPQGVYEFAFNVVPVGNDTVFAELKTLGPNQVIELMPGRAATHHVSKPLPAEAEAMPTTERLQRHREKLAATVRPHVAGFGNRVCCPLSGGIDSRLLLAALRAEGCRPSTYVYGEAAGEDVGIAQAIGKAEGFTVDWFDKEGYRHVEPDEFPEQVERNFQQYDALPNFGELFENGGNAVARDARHRGGALAASGGCGEIFRNFFFLPDRPLSAAAVARAFFARYAPGDATGGFEGRAFLRRIEDKLLEALGAEGERGPLPRPLIEQIYPRVRCRSLFGREISLEARYGTYLMPFLDHRLVAEAMRLPVRLKNAGRFEAMLLNAIDPALARHPSAYGHDFAGAPGLRHRFDEWATRVRPIWLRQRSYALQRRLRPMADEHGGLLSRDYLGRVIDLDFPVMRRFFNPERIGDTGLTRRIANLEYLAARLGSRLAR